MRGQNIFVCIVKKTVPNYHQPGPVMQSVARLSHSQKSQV